MEKDKKIKLIIGLFYFIFVGLFLYFIFSKFTLEEITSYEFIRNNREYFDNLKEETKSKIKETNCNVIEIPNLGLEKTQHNWHNTFSKLEIFNQTQFGKLVYLDVDILLRSNVDELFDHEHLSMCWQRLKKYRPLIYPTQTDFFLN